jgi:pilus assembly protein CpaE
MKSARLLADAVKIKVLVIAGSDPVGDWMAEVISAEKSMVYLGLVRYLSQALECVEKLEPDVILVDISSGILQQGNLINRLAAPVSGAAVIAVAMMGEVETVRQAMLHGAQGFLLKPFSEDELLASIRQAYGLVTQRRAELSHMPRQSTEAAPEPQPQAEIIAVFSPKGGVGCTTIAVNLAVALRSITGKPTTLIDGNFRFGDVDIALDIAAQTSIGTLLPYLNELDIPLLNRTLVAHSSGIRALLAPPRPDTADAIEPRQLTQLLTRLAALDSGYIVVDAWSSLDECTLSILDASQRVVLVTAPQVTAMRNTHRFLEVLRLLEYDLGRIVLVLNHCYQRSKFNLKEVERALGHPINQVIEHAPNQVTLSLNRGVPLVQEFENSSIAKNLFQLARFVANSQSG